MDRDSQYQSGDMVFTALSEAPAPLRQQSNGQVVSDPTPDPAAKRLPVLELQEAVGPRKSALRSLGLPVAPEGRGFEGLEVFYYRKLSDGDRVAAALTKRGIPFVSAGAILNADIAVNAIACGPDVPFSSVKWVAAALIGDGIPIRRIQSFVNPEAKRRRIEILTLTKDGRGRESIEDIPLTLEQVRQMDSCPPPPA